MIRNGAELSRPSLARVRAYPFGARVYQLRQLTVSGLVSATISPSRPFYFSCSSSFFPTLFDVPMQGLVQLQKYTLQFQVQAPEE